MASNDYEIANLALRHLGIGRTMSALSDSTEEARVMNAFYATARDEVLRAFAWPFATKFAALTKVADNPSDIDQEWSISYRYPSDCLMIRRIITGDRNPDRQAREPYRIGRDGTGLLIYSDYASAELEYTFQETTVSRYPPDFVIALSYRLAAYAAPALTGGDPYRLIQRMEALYAAAVMRARANAQNEEQQEEDPDAEWIRARN